MLGYSEWKQDKIFGFEITKENLLPGAARAFPLAWLLSQGGFLSYLWELGFQNKDRGAHIFSLSLLPIVIVTLVRLEWGRSQDKGRKLAGPWGRVLFSLGHQRGPSSSSLSRIPSTLLFSSCLTSDHHSLPRHALKLRIQGKERRKENFTLTLKDHILRFEERVLRYPC